MRFSGLVLALVLGVALALQGGTATRAGDPPPAQPPAEAELGREFQASALSLLVDWAKTIYRPSLSVAELGAPGVPVNPHCWGVYYFEFKACKELSAPTLVGFDVRRTDSIVTPFVGSIRGRISEICSVRRLAGALTLSHGSYDRIANSCLGKPHSACVAAGGKPVGKGKWGGAECTGGPEATIPIEYEPVLHYRWSDGRWEFDREEKAPAKGNPGSKT